MSLPQLRKPVFEVQREGASIILWVGGVGTRIIFPTEILAILQETRLLEIERQFYQAKQDTGVAVIDAYGERVSPFEFVERSIKAWRCKTAERIGIQVFANAMQRSVEEYW